ncbi:PEP-CTERM sorting domain-containing protein [Leptolyngbyaceae cyanobacterium CCMR0082]|uniref:PEP-CTERM sorting domain-containing protein n=2 Tax=Adonisia turfae TaxID=2950184 RepID=A0A6M0S901_9CYAN|nr:XDD3 family exosortase-dependent surface protein [Adonisia turfae]MDV3353814.1 PEP-CTERM sorting domain-containing protein [Leptothoe sp. LEGE 181152]NEZ57171.1 PEP-CTERM sorting domain-containing protein [Adonisia turfae CCMR0081]NEZ64543.1 PEP-CTERM sorting domain-containing protein [Adonisia turfae CCMR0082]
MKGLALLIGSALLSLTVPHAAHASTFHQGWNYSIDAFTDGSGGNPYEIRGLAIKETQDHVYVSVSGGSPLTGNSYHGAADGNVGWGDLLFNVTGDDINTANGSLFGVRFAGTNDSGVDQVGVFGNVTAQSVTQSNAGYQHLKQYYQYGWERQNTMGDLTTKQQAYDYMGETDAVLTSIADGTLLGSIDFLSDQDAAAAGLNFGHFDAVGSDTHTFRFNRSLLPGGEFIATLLMECANDGIALMGNLNPEHTTQDVPEPSAVLSFAAVGFLASLRLRRSESHS